ncbi:MAG: DUF6690 family protein [Planctomycetota bacterium]
MFSQLRLPVLLVAAVGGPYMLSETESGQGVMSSLSDRLNTLRPSTVSSGTATAAVDVAELRESGYAGHAHHEVERLRPVNSARFRYDTEVARRLGGLPNDPQQDPRLTGATTAELAEVLRFDITPAWVISRFARVSTVLADVNLEGLRVPVVTGTNPDDVAGTLTYYFDRSQKLQRLTLHGFTGDPRKVTHLASEGLKMSHQPTLEAGVMVRAWNGNPVHFLRLTHAPVVFSDAVHQKYTVFLELNHPDLPYGISPEASRVVGVDHGSGRW